MKSEDTTTAFTSKELLESTSILSLYTLKVVLWGRMEGIHNTDLSCKFLRMHFWPYCKDLASKLHTLEADETPWVKEDLSKMLPILYNLFEKVWHLSSILRILFFNKTLNLLVHWVHCHFVVQQQFPSLLRKVNHFKGNYVVHLNMNLYFSPSFQSFQKSFKASSCDSFIRIHLLCISDHISPIAIPFYRAHQPVTEASVLKRTCWWLN